MRTYIHVCVHTYMYTYIHVRVHTCTHTHMYAYTHVRIHTCTRTHMYTYIHVHLKTCTHVHVYTCTCVCSLHDNYCMSKIPLKHTCMCTEITHTSFCYNINPNHAKSYEILQGKKFSTVVNWYFHLFKWSKITTWQKVQAVSAKYERSMKMHGTCTFWR